MPESRAESVTKKVAVKISIIQSSLFHFFDFPSFFKIKVPPVLPTWSRMCYLKNRKGEILFADVEYSSEVNGKW